MERILNNMRADWIDIIQYISQQISKETYNYIKKMVTKTLLIIVSLLGIWFAPLVGAFYFIIILVATDTLTGVWSAYKTGVVTSNKAFQLVPKLIFYGLLIICGQALTYYVEHQIPWVKVALAGVAWIEIKSIDENFKKIFGYSFINKVIYALNKVKSFQKRQDDED